MGVVKEVMAMRNITIVRHSDIQPEAIQEFFSGYIYRKTNSDNFIEEFSHSYPDFQQWFKGIVYKGLQENEHERGNHERDILFLMDKISCGNCIAGFAIIKNTIDEKKICSFRISKPYRGEGLGRILMKNCMQELHTNAPLMTMPENCRDEFEKLLDEFHFKLTQILSDYYTKGVTEYVFNGHLKK